MNKALIVYNLFKDKLQQRAIFWDEIKELQEKLKEYNLFIETRSRGGIDFHDFMDIPDNNHGNFEWGIIERHLIQDFPSMDKQRLVAILKGSYKMFEIEPEKSNYISMVKLELIDSNIWHFSTAHEKWMEIDSQKVEYLRR